MCWAILQKDVHRVWDTDFDLYLLTLPRASTSYWSLVAFEVSGVTRKVSSEK